MRELHPIPLKTFNFNWMKKVCFWLSFFCLQLIFPSCIIINNPAGQYQPDESSYKPLPVNRERGGIVYFNARDIGRVRVKGVHLEIMKSHKSELEVSSNNIQYLKVLRFKDELYLFYDFPKTGAESGFHKLEHKFVLYINHPIFGLNAEQTGRITVRDLLFTPHLDVQVAHAGNVKCDVNTQEFNLIGNSASSFTGWVESQKMKVNLKGAAIAEIGGVSENVEIITKESARFTGEKLHANRVIADAGSRSKIIVSVGKELEATVSERGEILYHPLSEIVKKETNNGGIINSF